MLTKLQRLGIHNLQDLLFHLPMRYQDRTSVKEIGSLKIGDEVVIEAEVVNSEVKFAKKRTMLSFARWQRQYYAAIFSFFRRAEKQFTPGKITALFW